MSLYEEIQAAAANSNSPITDLLRKCSILAARIRNEDFSNWVNSELNGYANSDDLPRYRILGVGSFGYFAGPFGASMNKVPIPPASVKKNLRHFVNESRVVQPIAVLEDLLNDSDATFQIPWNPDFTTFVGSEIYANYNCIKAWQTISRTQIVGIVDTVRNKILAFILELEAEVPNVGDWPKTPDSTRQEIAERVFNTTINGSVGQMISGSHDFQANSQFVVQGDFSTLSSALQEIGVDEEELQELETAIQQDASRANQQKIGESVATWIANISKKATLGFLKIAAGSAVAAVLKLISQFYGIQL